MEWDKHKHSMSTSLSCSSMLSSSPCLIYTSTHIVITAQLHPASSMGDTVAEYKQSFLDGQTSWCYITRKITMQYLIEGAVMCWTSFCHIFGNFLFCQSPGKVGGLSLTPLRSRLIQPVTWLSSFFLPLDKHLPKSNLNPDWIRPLAKGNLTMPAWAQITLTRLLHYFADF